MKTLAALAISAGALMPPSLPPLVDADLVGFTIDRGQIIRLEWDINKDGLEDLRVYYQFRVTPEGAYVSDPFMYQQDLNNNDEYDKNETFRLTYDEKEARK